MLEVDPVEPELLALGIEASWRLSDWKSLDTLTQYSNSVLSSGSDARNVFAQTSIVGNVANLNEITVAESRGYSDRALKMPPETAFQIRLGKIVSSLQSREQTKFYKELDLCRREIMQSLSAAFKESYGRTYPYIARLQILSELEDGWDILQQASIERKDERIKSLEWTNRMGLMSSSYQTISLTLATRRSVLSICGMRKAVTENWLDQCQSMRKMGRYDTARLALRMAESMDLGPYKQDIVLLEECQLLRCEGEINKALSLLEPIELNPYELSKNWSDITVVTHGRNLSAASRTLLDIKNDEKRKNLFARRLLMATQLMVENRQKHGKVIVERYNVYLNLQDKDDLVRFELGRYHESLYSEMKEKQAAPDSTTSERDIAAQEEASIGYVLDAIRSYARALQSGLVPIMTQALPRMLTLWFSTTWNRDVEEKKPSALRMQQEVSKLMSTEVFSNLSSYIWFHCMPQLVSRVGHKHKKTVVIITELLTRVLIAYPSNAIWHIAGLICSRHETRKSVVKNVMSKAISSLRESGRISEAKMLINSAGLFDQLEQLARLEKPESKKDMKIERNIGHNMDLSKFLVPTQQTLLLVAPRTNHSNSVSASSLAYHGSEDVYISRFDKEVEIQDTKAAPKTISIITSSGNKLKFLIKCEATGDLRKDARMMEFNSVFNRLLKEDSKGHKNNLRLRTYAVVCLNEECGIIEWVPNTTCLRHIINKSFSLSNGEFTPFRYDQTAFPKVMKSLQTKYVAKIDELVSEFKALVWDKTRPCFHLWFLDQFPDPTQWLEARTRFTRSAAVWSAVGHVIGLGDRHTQNILLDITNGECVHVDFDCIFDHGLTLPCPEIVPFRLSPNMIDAMGVTGIEGVFRNTMEMTMGLLRSNKDTLLSVLEPFLRDPTVHWDRGGKAQQGNNEPPRHVAASVDDMNVLAKDALLKVSGRLSGIYNITHPKADLIEEDCIVNERVVPTRGLGAAKDEGLSMSVSGQVKRIIDEAILIENLAQMFVGELLFRGILLCILYKFHFLYINFDLSSTFRLGSVDVIKQKG